MERPLTDLPFVEVAKGVTLDTFEITKPAITQYHTIHRLSEMYPLPPMLRVYSLHGELPDPVGPEVTEMATWKDITKDVLMTRPMLADTYTFHLQTFNWETDGYGFEQDVSSPTGTLLSRVYCLPYYIERTGDITVYEHGKFNNLISGYVMVDRRELRKHHNAERCTTRMLVDVAAYAEKWLKDMVLCSKNGLYTVTTYRKDNPDVVSCILLRGKGELDSFTRFLKK